MTISSTEAAAALRDIAETGRRTRESGAYHVASPHFILWGLVWAAGYAGCGLTDPARWGLVWLPAIVIGVIGATAIGLRTKQSAQEAPGAATARWLMLALGLGLFMGGAYIVFAPVSPLPYLVFPALMAALIYVVIGAVLSLNRFVAIGAILFLVTMAGFLYAKPWLPFWIAAAGGGGLFLGGLWLRKV
jgi:VIT1/CCC1 family predicted Fe2+/Mn2+ transporter